MIQFLDGRVTLYPGDCIEVLRSLPENSVDSAVMDPPYFLTSINKRFGAEDAAPAQYGSDGAFSRVASGFMNKSWDAPPPSPIDPAFANWLAGFIDGEGCFHVHKKTVNGCETYDCQFSITLRADDKPMLVEIQRQLGGLGSVADRPGKGNAHPQARYCISSKTDCQKLRAILSVFNLRAKKARDFEIWGHALDAWVNHEPGSSWEDVAHFRRALMAVRNVGSIHRPESLFFYRVGREILRVLKPGGYILAFASTRGFGRMSVAFEDAGFINHPLIAWIFAAGMPKATRIRACAVDGPFAGIDVDGWRYGGQALKPAIEPIYMGQKPFSEDNGTLNILQHGTGAINIDGCRIGQDDTRRMKSGGAKDFPHEDDSWTPAPVMVGSASGRWPANVIHDGSDEVVASFPDSNGQQGDVTGDEPSSKINQVYRDFGGRPATQARGDSGSASRFFYSAKADADDRIGSKHPTVKPVDLMQYLVRMVTPPGGTVLDCFAGTGTTGEAAWREGFNAILIEREPEYQADIAERMRLCLAGPDEKKREIIKRRGLADDDAGPLFSAGAA